MFDFLKERIGEVSCLLGFHEEENLDPSRGICGGFKCKRKDCNWKIQPIEWPKPPVATNWETGTFTISHPEEVPKQCLEAVNLSKGSTSDDLKMYVLIREDTPVDIVPLIAMHTAMLTYRRFHNDDVVKMWFESNLQKTVICKVTPTVFEKAKEYGDYFALTEVHHKELGELGLGFKIRFEYPKFFKFLKLYKVE